MVQRFERFACRWEMSVNQSFAARGIVRAAARISGGKNVGNVCSRVLQRGVNRAANHARAERADGFVNGHDAAHFGGVHFVAARASRSAD